MKVQPFCSGIRREGKRPLVPVPSATHRSATRIMVTARADDHPSGHPTRTVTVHPALPSAWQDGCPVNRFRCVFIPTGRQFVRIDSNLRSPWEASVRTDGLGVAVGLGAVSPRFGLSLSRQHWTQGYCGQSNTPNRGPAQGHRHFQRVGRLQWNRLAAVRVMPLFRLMVRRINTQTHKGAHHG